MFENIFSTEWYSSVPAFTHGYPVCEHSADEKCYIAEYSDVGTHTYYDYLAELEAAGFVARETYTLDRNLYALYDGEKATVYIAYSAKADTVRLYIEEKGSTPYPAKNADADRAYPTMWQLPLDNKASVENGGMRYIFLLPDNTFMVIDGGYCTDPDANSLYEFLAEHTEKGKKPVISAWLITHLHYDHYGTLIRFADLYADKVDVKAFYYHLNPDEQSTGKLTPAMAKWPEAVHYNKMHTGMEFRLPGVKVNIIQTQEDLYPIIPRNYNDASMAFRVTVGEQRILFLGDCEVMANHCMLKYLSDEIIKSDIVQYSHHGYQGVHKEFYDIAAPHTILWPMNIDGYQENGYNVFPQNVFGNWHQNRYGFQNETIPNRYISFYAPYVKKILIPEAESRMDFPYSPTGSRLPDFEGIFIEKTKDYKPE